MTKEQMERVAMHVLTCATLREAAKKSEISEPALYRLRKRKPFQEILKEIKNQIYGEAMMKAQAYTLEAMDVLRAVMTNKKSNDTAKVSAARTILEMSNSAYFMDEIETKIDRLEQKHA